MLHRTPPASLPRKELSKLTDFAVELAGQAGEATLPFFRSVLVIEDKQTGGSFDPVTEADRLAEQVIRARLAESYPEHGIYGEEFGHQQGNGLTWVIDPIDGTRAFMTGMLHWGVLLALFDGEKPVLGVMHQPFTGETFYGTNDSAYYRRGDEERALRCRSCESLASAVLTTTSPRFFDDPAHLAAFHRLEAQVKLTRYGGDCYIYAMVAMGMVDLATDSGLNAYDIQALMPIIRGAGGVVTTVDGGDPSMGGFVLAAGDARLHELALRRMAGDG